MGRLVTANHVPHRKDSWRITLTWPVINNASSVFFLIGGADKALVLNEVLTGPRDPEASQSTDMALKRYTHSDSGSGRCCAFTRNRWGRLRGSWRGNDDSGGRCGGHQGKPCAVRLYRWKTEIYTRRAVYRPRIIRPRRNRKGVSGADKVTSACFWRARTGTTMGGALPISLDAGQPRTGGRLENRACFSDQ